MVYTDYTISINDNIVFLDFTERCASNRQYTVTVSPGISGTLPNGDIAALESEYQFWFTSLYCPLYTTIGRVKLQAGPVADTFTDDTIYRMIHKNSLDAIDLLIINNASANVNIAYDYYGCDWQGAPFHVRRYVECKTAYDVLALAKLNNSSSGGTNGGDQLKTLGDMTIKYGGGSNSSSNDDPKRAADLYECWRESMRMMRNMNVAVRGYYDESKGWKHPALSYTTNRVIRPVSKSIGYGTPGTPRWRGI